MFSPGELILQSDHISHTPLTSPILAESNFSLFIYYNTSFFWYCFVPFPFQGFSIIDEQELMSPTLTLKEPASQLCSSNESLHQPNQDKKTINDSCSTPTTTTSNSSIGTPSKIVSPALSTPFLKPSDLHKSCLSPSGSFIIRMTCVVQKLFITLFIFFSSNSSHTNVLVSDNSFEQSFRQKLCWPQTWHQSQSVQFVLWFIYSLVRLLTFQ